MFILFLLFFSTDGSHHNQNPNAISLNKKVSILPDIKVNIIFDAQKNKSDSDNYDSDGFEVIKIK